MAAAGRKMPGVSPARRQRAVFHAGRGPGTFVATPAYRRLTGKGIASASAPASMNFLTTLSPCAGWPRGEPPEGRGNGIIENARLQNG